MISLHLGDCLTLVKDLDRSTITAVVTDPPYGFGYNSSRPRKTPNVMGGTQLVDRQWSTIEGEDHPFDPTPWLSFPTVLLWGANHYADRLPTRSGWLVWDKRDGSSSDDGADCELAWTSRNSPARLYRHKWRGIVRAGEENIAIGGAKLHPHQKPVALMIWCLEQLGLKPGDVVLDPYMGSGTTGVACARLGIEFVGYEIDPKYYTVAEKRIGQAELQLPLIMGKRQ